MKRLTQLLLLSEPHDGHGLHGLIEHLIVLGGRDGHKAIGEERVVVEAFQKQVIWKERETGQWSGKTRPL